MRSNLNAITKKANQIKSNLEAQGVSCKFDNRDTLRPGAKFAHYELQGIPIRLAIGPKDLENGTVELARRDTLSKQSESMEDVASLIPELLNEIQKSLFDKALSFRDSHITKVDNFEEFKSVLESKGGFVLHIGMAPMKQNKR